MDITAVVVCDDRPGGLDPLAPIGGVPMVVHAVRGLLGGGLVGVKHVRVLAPQRMVSAVAYACRGLPVSVRAGLGPGSVGTHVDQRGGAAAGDGSMTSRSNAIVLLHEAARPLAPPELAVAVVDAVRSGHLAAVPVLPMTDTVKQLDGAGRVTGSPDRSTLRVVQTPVAVRADLLAALPWPAPRLLESGVPLHTVPGHPLAFPVRTAWDLELAELLVTTGVHG
jgi:2-C-methyl-D-erythritol 4-phosphate cytidylyltransferase